MLCNVRSVTLMTMLGSTVVAASGQAQQPNYPFSGASVFAGSGNHGLNARVDIEVGGKNSSSSSRFYLEFGGQGITFDQPTFNFNYILYPSKSNVLSGGVGLGQEFHLGSRMSITPFGGLRAEYVRFSDQALIDAIGTNSVIRWAYVGGPQVGPVVNNGYGDAVSFDLGGRVGLKLSNWLEINGTLAYSPIKFDTKTSLFGQYRGEAPYPNPFYVQRKPLRLEVGLRWTGHPRP